MGLFFVYILKSSVCLAIFYLFYRLLLARETFHRFNRFSLLGILLLSCLLPLVEVSVKQETEVHQTMLTLEQLLMMADAVNATEAGARAETATVTWIQVALLVYLAGIVFFAFRNVYSLVRLLMLLKSGKKEDIGSYLPGRKERVTLIVHNCDIAPFSWMGYIVISRKDLEENGREILIHELAHIHNRHSWDLLVADVCIFFQWFNPASWLLKQELQNIHEFEADETVIKEGVDAKQYQLLLIKKAGLKTTGIVQYMFQCGFPVPVSEVSELPVFESIFIDIGDEQSIDNDLSTYSSHLLNMKHMLAGASGRTLVLIDEFGSGTEPVIGGAIAEAILERLLGRGCYGVITTHYANIKYYAASVEGIANGAMMFDVQNIRPLFRLEMGKPGSSFAVEIARKIGLPEDIIRAASEKAGSDHINIEKQLREIARDKHYWEQKRDRIRLTDRKVEELEQNYAEQLAKIRAERQEILKKAKQEARQLIADANKQIENTIKTIREAQAEKELTRLARRELDDFREAVEKADEAGNEAAVAREIERIERRRRRRAERRAQQGAQPAAGEAAPQPEKPREVVAGSKVRMAGQEMVGVVQSVKGKRAQVAFGQILTTVDKGLLTVVSNNEYREATRPVAARTVLSVDISSRKLNFKDHIDVRGMRAADALDEVRNFIDDALMVGVGTVSILHGKGTGALKEEIRRYLRTVPEIVSAVDEHADRGGAGITIVTFDLS